MIQNVRKIEKGEFLQRLLQTAWEEEPLREGLNWDDLHRCAQTFEIQTLDLDRVQDVRYAVRW